MIEHRALFIARKTRATSNPAEGPCDQRQGVEGPAKHATIGLQDTGTECKDFQDLTLSTQEARP